jgi:hypothetical protein
MAAPTASGPAHAPADLVDPHHHVVPVAHSCFSTLRVGARRLEIIAIGSERTLGGVRRHDHDAGGDPALLTAKAALREEVWAALSVEGVARFPAPDGRIPNFVGAEAAAAVWPRRPSGKGRRP